MAEPPSIDVDTFVADGRGGFVVRGWGADEADRPAEFALSHPRYGRHPLRPYRYNRPDVTQWLAGLGRPADHDRVGLIGFGRVADAETPASGWAVEMSRPGRPPEKRPCDAPVTDPTAARAALLEIAGCEPAPGPALAEQLVPPLEVIQKRLLSGAGAARVDEYGRPPVAPPVTIVVTLYGRLDFLEHQLCHFADDPEFARLDLVYVLDDPRLDDELRARAAGLHRFYRVPFRVVTLNQNVGFPTANNVGAAFARGRDLILLNSDVFPDRPGWVSTLSRFRAARPAAGAVGVKLIYEDDTLQHAGMFHQRTPGRWYWLNQHYFKGLPRGLRAASAAREVPAVTAACVLLPVDLYHDVGGLDPGYIFMDFEDSELCLRVREAGREVWYCPDAELYHLEGQSWPSAVRQRASTVNAWRHTLRWGRQIEAVMARFPAAGPGG